MAVRVVRADDIVVCPETSRQFVDIFKAALEEMRQIPQPVFLGSSGDSFKALYKAACDVREATLYLENAYEDLGKSTLVNVQARNLRDSQLMLLLRGKHGSEGTWKEIAEKVMASRGNLNAKQKAFDAHAADFIKFGVIEKLRAKKAPFGRQVDIDKLLARRFAVNEDEAPPTVFRYAPKQIEPDDSVAFDPKTILLSASASPEPEPEPQPAILTQVPVETCPNAAQSPESTVSGSGPRKSFVAEITPASKLKPKPAPEIVSKPAKNSVRKLAPKPPAPVTKAPKISKLSGAPSGPSVIAAEPLRDKNNKRKRDAKNDLVEDIAAQPPKKKATKEKKPHRSPWGVFANAAFVILEELADQKLYSCTEISNLIMARGPPLINTKTLTPTNSLSQSLHALRVHTDNTGPIRYVCYEGQPRWQLSETYREDVTRWNLPVVYP